jgi:hypothetical protein
MIRYLARLESTTLVLWCYFCWYVAIVSQYFDSTPGLWLSSVGIAFLIGFALNIAARQKGQKTDKRIVFRLYLFPFCVSSYSALIKGKGFILLFPTEPKPLLIGIGACCGFVCVSMLCKWADQYRHAARIGA